MQSFLSELYANASGPLISAILLGLLTAIAPCPMTINITAIGYIGRDFSNKKRLFLNGIFYAMGTIFAYSALAMILYFGADKFRISSLFQQYSEKIIGPLLLVIGVLMLGIVNIKFPAFNRLTEKFRARQHFRKWDAFLLGGILALAFCPYSGILYYLGLNLKL
jgi:cytochrome c-type biogenesis protein